MSTYSEINEMDDPIVPIVPIVPGVSAVPVAPSSDAIVPSPSGSFVTTSNTCDGSNISNTYVPPPKNTETKFLEINFNGKETWMSRWGSTVGALTFGILECVNTYVNTPTPDAFDRSFHSMIWGTFYGAVVGNFLPMAAPAVICSIPIIWLLKKDN